MKCTGRSVDVFRIAAAAVVSAVFILFVSTLSAGTIYKYRNASGAYTVFTDRELSPDELAKDGLQLYGTEGSSPPRQSDPASAPPQEIAQPSLPSLPATAALPETKTVALLELLEWSARGEKGSLVGEGRVKNIAGRPLLSVQAAVSFSSAGGEVVSSCSSPLDFNPLQPVQISSFTVTCPGKPGVKKAVVEFKLSSGEAVSCVPDERRILSLNLQPPPRQGADQQASPATSGGSSQSARRPPPPPQGTEPTTDGGAGPR